jgi:hypothetical protein
MALHSSHFEDMESINISPNEYEHLPNDRQYAVFMNILNNHAQLGLDQPGYIYRPLYPLPMEWEGYSDLMYRYFRYGERKQLTEKDVVPSNQNYTMLYRWVTGACVYCGHHNIRWFEEDKQIEYYCYTCNREIAFFIKGSWAYS